MTIENFYPYIAFGDNKAEKMVWDAFKSAFQNDSDCVGYFRYPIFTRNGNLRKEPDILFIHRRYGVWVIEIKGCHIDNIAGIHGHAWQMEANWRCEQETPLLQAEDGMFALRSRLEERRETRGLMQFHFRVCLPIITQDYWRKKGFADLPSTQGAVWLKDDLKEIKQKIEEGSQDFPQRLNDNQWSSILAVIQGTLPIKPARDIPPGTSPDNPLRIIHEMESRFKFLDSRQSKIAFEIPPGPQRIRGLAGSGKTVLLTKKIARMHAAHPEWTIAFVFFTQALYDQILELIALYYREMTHQEPNWDRVQVLHAWGSHGRNGFYRKLAMYSGIQPLTVNDAPYKSPAKAFEYVCNQLEQQLPSPPIIFDAIVIDEGQDLPPSFYRLANKTLSDPQRLIWGYDEAQGIGSLIVPTGKDIFKDSDPNLGGITGGIYEGGIRKAYRLNRCYRTPRKLLMLAHAVNMGLFREGGALQGVSTKENWKALGYEIVSGDFSSASVHDKKTVSITRPAETSPHPIDQDNFSLKDALGDILTLHTFANEEDEQSWIAEQIAKDIQLGFDPWDIMVTGPVGDYETKVWDKDTKQFLPTGYFYKLQRKLTEKGIPSIIAGKDTGTDIFRKDGHVTIANIFRAKGNEAWKVYACRFHYATQPLHWKEDEKELHKRNEAFVALTRSRIWCVVTGLEGGPIFSEVKRALERYPEMTFPAYNKASLQRSTDEE